MNTLEDIQRQNYYNLHASAVSIIVVLTGETCKGLFDYSYYSKDQDKAGIKKQCRMAHFTTYIGYKAYFQNRRNYEVTIEGTSYKICETELLNDLGAVSIWLV